MKRCLDTRRTAFTISNTGNVRATARSEAELRRDPAVNPPEKALAIDVRCNHLFWCRNDDAVYGIKNIPIPIPVKKKVQGVPVEKHEPKILGEKIKAARGTGLLNLTQVEFAERMETTQSNVAKWEKGVYAPSPQQLVRLARLLAGRPESLYFYEQAGVAPSFFTDETAKMPALLRDTKTINDLSIAYWDPEMMEFVILAVHQELKKRGRKMSAQRLAKIIILVYEHCCKVGSRDSEMLKRFLDAA
jgi:DNA-binding transcriptional regulator YiaG